MRNINISGTEEEEPADSYGFIREKQTEPKGTGNTAMRDSKRDVLPEVNLTDHQG